jgi:DNA-binding CsgD family transcriptional regulator
MRRGEPSTNYPFGLAKLVGGAFECWVLDPFGRVFESHRPNSRCSAVEVRCGKIQILDSSVQRILDQLLIRAPEEASEQWGCVVGPRGTISSFIKIITFDQAQKRAFDGAAIAIVAFDWFRREPASELLRLCFGLTPAEAQVAVGLVGGKSLKDISGQRGSSIVTARTQLKHILAKMHLNRQADAIAILDRFANFVGGKIQIVPDGEP